MCPQVIITHRPCWIFCLHGKGSLHASLQLHSIIMTHLFALCERTGVEGRGARLARLWALDREPLRLGPARRSLWFTRRTSSAVASRRT